MQHKAKYHEYIHVWQHLVSQEHRTEDFTTIRVYREHRNTQNDF